MREKQVWDIVKDLWEKYDCKKIIPADVLRLTIADITGIIDTGSTTRAVKSLLDFDVIRADYGKYIYGTQGRRILKKFQLIDDDRIDITPEFEIETHEKIKSDIRVSHHADIPELPEDVLKKVKKFQKKPEVDFGAQDNAE